MKNFYDSKEWIELKNIIVDVYPKKCMKCGYEKYLQVDHIKPKSLWPRLKLYPKNLQILCYRCNMEKSNMSSIDYRKKEDLFELKKRLFSDSILKKYLYISIPKESKAMKKHLITKRALAKKRRRNLYKKKI